MSEIARQLIEAEEEIVRLRKENADFRFTLTVHSGQKSSYSLSREEQKAIKRALNLYRGEKDEN